MLEAQNVSFGYTKGRRIIDGLTVGISPSDRLVIKAPSGTGKTTLCKLLAGYEIPSSGRVVLDGDPLPKRGTSPVQLIGQHPESTLDPRLRMKESLREAMCEVPDEGHSLLRSLGIRKEWLARFPQELSGGELQRFCIARAVAVRPKYLICDEISTMLDALTRASIWNFLLDHAEEHGIGLIAVTHSESLSKRIATKVLEL